MHPYSRASTAYAFSRRTRVLSVGGTVYGRTFDASPRSFGPEANLGHELASLVIRPPTYRNSGKTEEAGPLYKRSLAIVEKDLGPDHPRVATSLKNLADLLESQGKYEEAAPLLERLSLPRKL
ncbi:unnamed protein product [Ectocarpus sp. 12 AP-2014]